MSLHPEQIELSDEEQKIISNEAANFADENKSLDSWNLIYDLKRENLKLQLIISKFKV